MPECVGGSKLAAVGVFSRRLLLGIVAAVVLAGAGFVAWWTFLRGEDGTKTAEAYLAAWQKREWAEMSTLVVDPPHDFVETHERTFQALGVEEARFALVGSREDNGADVARFRARLKLAGLGEWTYDGVFRLVENDGEWRVAWSPAVLHPAVRPGMRLERVREWPRRAPILGADGTPLATARPVVEVGVEPRRIKNRRRLVAALARYVEADPKQVVADLEAPGVQPNWFIPVAQLRPARYEQVKPKIYPVPGTVFRRSTARLAPSDGFAAHVLGSVGDVTAELLEDLGAPYIAGDRVGLSGLERAFERELAGRPSGEVRVLADDGSVVEVLKRFEARSGRPLRTTLDADTQAVAENALAAVRKPAALVALDARTGAIRAAVSRPVEEFNRALAARYPPGSTFKIVTTAALLEQGLSPNDTVPCPDEVVVGGKPFRNAEGAALGPIPFTTAFAESCNTAFVQLAARLERDALVREARQFGFGARYELPLDVAGGRFPRPRDEAEQAAAGIGQGRAEASPVHMATVAAAAASGSWRPPVLLADERGRAVRALEPAAAQDLRKLMRLVVTEGAGEEADVPGDPVMGKTGTAEFGPGSPPATHAWFVGFRGSLAFAVVVEGGGFGGEVAAPIAARFLTEVDERRR